MFIFSNLATSLDGKIATAKRSFFPLGTPEDHKQMQVLRTRCDALLVGASTFRCYKNPSTVAGASKQPINMILSSTLSGFSPKWKFFQATNIQRILFVGPKTPASRIKKFSKTCEVIVLKNPTKKLPIPIQIIRFLEKRGLNRLLVEGGGEVMWDFVRLNLIDEFHVTLTPKIVGGNQSPTLVDGVGFLEKDVLSLKLKQCRIAGDELYLTYSKTPTKK